MYYYLWGMHWFWWVFWVLLWMIFFSFLMPIRRSTYRELQSPLQLLKRRYAAGEITSEEYEERRAKLLRDESVRSKGNPGTVELTGKMSPEHVPTEHGKRSVCRSLPQ
jgi:putative membrane protein